MPSFPYLVEPATLPPLDPGFRPAVLANRAFVQAVKDSGDAVSLVLGLERGDGFVSRYETHVFAEGSPHAGANLFYTERLAKFLLWQRGAYKIYVGGPASIGAHLEAAYQAGGLRAFDAEFMGDSVYAQSFEIISCTAEEVPAAHETTAPLGRHLDGCRIGFDLGASDRKVSAVVEGEAIYTEEVVWEPRKNSDPQYHVSEVKAALATAASKMPRVDAIGGSSAGVYVNNRPMIASLFRGIAPDDYPVVREMFINIAKEMNVPLDIVNDGDVTALAGAMSLEEDGVLGIALGSSEAVGYVNPEGNITGWLNELAFAPVDYNTEAACCEWSKDFGVGALYFSQQCVFHLASRAGIEVPEGEGITDAARLKHVQGFLEKGHEGAMDIWRSMGIYLGYSLAHYADFYAINYVLILGRCTSGRGGDLILNGATQLLQREFPDLAKKINVQLPDEKSRRVGQSIAAASLPQLNS